MSTGAPLECRDHPFFEDIFEIPEEQPFYNCVFASVGDIFEGFMFDRALVKKLILEEVYPGVQKLETFNIQDAPENVVSKMAITIALAEKMGIQVVWINKIIGEISSRKDHFATLDY